MRKLLQTGVLPPNYDIWVPKGPCERMANAIGKATLAHLLTYCYQFAVCDMEWEDPNGKPKVTEVTLVVFKINAVTNRIHMDVFDSSKSGVEILMSEVGRLSRRMPVFFDDAAQDMERLKEYKIPFLWGFSPMFPVGVWSCQSIVPRDSKINVKNRHRSLDDTMRTALFLLDFCVDTTVTLMHVWNEDMCDLSSESKLHKATERAIEKIGIRSLVAYTTVNSLLKSLQIGLQKEAQPNKIDFSYFHYPEAFGFVDEETEVTEFMYEQSNSSLQKVRDLRGDLIELHAPLKMRSVNYFLHVARNGWRLKVTGRDSEELSDTETWVSLNGLGLIKSRKEYDKAPSALDIGVIGLDQLKYCDPYKGDEFDQLVGWYKQQEVTPVSEDCYESDDLVF